MENKQKQPSSTYSALIIDDNPGDLFLATQILRQSGRFEHIFDASNGETALRLFEDGQSLNCERLRGSHSLAIFLDIQMPRMDGFEFLQEFDRVCDTLRCNRVIISMLSSSSQQRDRKKALAYDLVRHYFVKPMTRDEVAKVLTLLETTELDLEHE